MAIIEAKIDNLFPSPVMSLKLDDAEQLNKELLKDIARLRAESEGLNRSNQKGWHSEDYLFRREEASFKSLCTNIIGAVKAMTQQNMPELTNEEMQFEMQGWINVNPSGAMNTPHDHPHFTWSGCYYVSTPKADSERSGNIEFLDPRTNMGGYGIKGSKTFGTKVRMNPTAGRMLLFPSYLMHWVYPNDSEEERVSIAFNARMVKKT